MNNCWSWFKQLIWNWQGQVAGAAIAALICFVSMYGAYLHLAKQLPDGSKIYEKTGQYEKKNWSRGEPTSTLMGNSIFCSISAFSRGACLFDGSGNTVTVVIEKFPRLWGDIDVVITARKDETLLYDFNTQKIVEFWKDKSIYDCFFYSFWVFLFAFLGLRGLNKQFSKDQSS